MIKTVFLDYTGTIVRMAGPEMEEMVRRILKGSSIHDPQQILAWWFGNLRTMEAEHFLDTYADEETLCMMLLERAQEEIGLKEDLGQLQQLNIGLWRNGPVYEDAKIFLDRCPLPVYVLTNNSVKYVQENLEKKGLKAAGIISADMARACKPHKELFLKGLEIAGSESGQTLMIGDSAGDQDGALAAGMQALLLDRKGKYAGSGRKVISSLTQALDCL